MKLLVLNYSLHVQRKLFKYISSICDSKSIFYEHIIANTRYAAPHTLHKSMTFAFVIEVIRGVYATKCVFNIHETT